MQREDAAVSAVPLSRDGSVHVTDERFNAGSHVVALCFAIVGAGLLIVQASAQGDPWKIAALAVFGLSLIVLFGASSIHHALDLGPRVNEVLRTLDYDAVFLVIAGSVTPLVVVLFPTPYGWTILGAIWVLATAGVVLRSVWRQVPKWLTNTLYIALGWMSALLVGAAQDLPWWPLALMVGSGVAYTVGFVIFVLERPNPWPGVFGFHELWHLLVIIGALLHYLLVYWYVLPATA